MQQSEEDDSLHCVQRYKQAVQHFQDSLRLRFLPYLQNMPNGFGRTGPAFPRADCLDSTCSQTNRRHTPRRSTDTEQAGLQCNVAPLKGFQTVSIYKLQYDDKVIQVQSYLSREKVQETQNMQGTVQ